MDDRVEDQKTYLLNKKKECMNYIEGSLDFLKQVEGFDIAFTQEDVDKIMDCKHDRELPVFYWDVIDYLSYDTGDDGDYRYSYDVRLAANNFCDDVETIQRCNRTLEKI